MVIRQNYTVTSLISLPAATKLGHGNIFRSVCQEFCPRGGGEGRVSASVHAGINLPWEQTPPRKQTSPAVPLEQTPPPLGADTPQSRHPREHTPPRSRHPHEQTPPWSRHLLGADTPKEQIPHWSRHPPGADTPQEGDCSIRSTSGRYASCCNAFLFKSSFI